MHKGSMHLTPKRNGTAGTEQAEALHEVDPFHTSRPPSQGSPDSVLQKLARKHALAYIACTDLLKCSDIEALSGRSSLGSVVFTLINASGFLQVDL